MSWFWPSKVDDDARQADIERFRAFCGIGESFNYLGRECVVTGHATFIPGLGVIAMLQANYCDNLGVIRPLQWRISELPGLQNQQKPQKAESP